MRLLDSLASRLGYTRKYSEDSEVKFDYPSTIEEIEKENFKFIKTTDVLSQRTTKIENGIDDIMGAFRKAEEIEDISAMKDAINLAYNLCLTTITPWLRNIDNPKLLKKWKLFQFKYNLNHDVPNSYNKLMIYAKYLLGFFTEIDVSVPRPVIIHSTTNRPQYGSDMNKEMEV